jgi:hypothetical protein
MYKIMLDNCPYNAINEEIGTKKYIGQKGRNEIIYV